MSVRNGLTWLAGSALALSALAGCSSAPAQTSQSAASSTVSSESTASSTAAANDSDLRVLCPMGAPALASLGLAENGANIEYVEGQDLLVSELSKKDSEYDMIIAPVNLGVKTWSESQAYQLDGILTWGNLYIVSPNEDWNTPDTTLAAFGENAVPGMVFSNLYPDVAANVEYYPSVVEASTALLSGKASAAMLAQPAAAGAIAKAGANGTELSIAEDLQSVWSTSHETENNGYPQAALFIKNGAGDKYRQYVQQIEDYINAATPEKVEASVDAYSAERLGVPNAKIAGQTWAQQNIKYVKASEAQSDLQVFLDTFGITIPEGLIAE